MRADLDYFSRINQKEGFFIKCFNISAIKKGLPILAALVVN